MNIDLDNEYGSNVTRISFEIRFSNPNLELGVMFSVVCTCMSRKYKNIIPDTSYDATEKFRIRSMFKPEYFT